MHEQLRELVKTRLSGAVNCPAKDDIIEEITADLTAKYNDLLEQGMDPETAFDKVQDGIGDLLLLQSRRGPPVLVPPVLPGPLVPPVLVGLAR